MNPSHQSASAYPPPTGDLYCYQPSIQPDLNFTSANVHDQLTNPNSPVPDDLNKYSRTPCNNNIAYFRGGNQMMQSQQQLHHIQHRPQHIQYDSNSAVHPQLLYYPNSSNHRSRNVAFQLASKPHSSDSSYTPVLINGYSPVNQAIAPQAVTYTQDPNDVRFSINGNEKNCFDWSVDKCPSSHQTSDLASVKLASESNLQQTMQEVANNCPQQLSENNVQNDSSSPSRQSNLTTPPTERNTPLTYNSILHNIDENEPSRYQKAKSYKNNNPYGSSLDALLRVAEIDQNDADRKQFADRLRSIWIAHSIKLRCLPTITKIPIDLYMLYTLVKERNGYIEVTIKKRWREVANGLGIFNCQSAAFGVKRNYTKLGILHYECMYDLNGSDPDQILKDIEAQKPPPSSRKRKRVQRSDHESNSPNDTTISGTQSILNEGGSLHGHSPKANFEQHASYTARSDEFYNGQQVSMKMHDSIQHNEIPTHINPNVSNDRCYLPDINQQQYSMYAFNSPHEFTGSDKYEQSNSADMYYGNRQRIYLQANGQMIPSDNSAAASTTMIQHPHQLLSQNYFHQVRGTASPSFSPRLDEYGCPIVEEYMHDASAPIVEHGNQYYQVTPTDQQQQYIPYECSQQYQQYQQSFPNSYSNYIDSSRFDVQNNDSDNTKMYDTSLKGSVTTDHVDQIKSPPLSTPSKITEKIKPDETNLPGSSVCKLAASLVSQQRRRRARMKLYKLEMKDIHSLLLKLESGLQCEVSHSLNLINNALANDDNNYGVLPEIFDLNRIPRLASSLASTLKRSIHKSSNGTLLLSNQEGSNTDRTHDDFNKCDIFNECTRCNVMDAVEFHCLACSTAIRNLSVINSNRSCLAKNHMICKLLIKILIAKQLNPSDSQTCSRYLHAALKENSLVTLSNIAESFNLMSISEQLRQYFTKSIYVLAQMKCPLYSEPHLTVDLLAIEILTKLATTTLENREYLISQCTDEHAQKLFQTIAKWLIECNQVSVQSDDLVKAELAICLLLFLLENHMYRPISNRNMDTQSALLQGLLVHLRHELQSTRSGSDKCALKCARCMLTLTSLSANACNTPVPLNSRMRTLLETNLVDLLFSSNSVNTAGITSNNASTGINSTGSTLRKLTARRRKSTQFSLECESASSLLAQCLRKLKPNR